MFDVIRIFLSMLRRNLSMLRRSRHYFSTKTWLKFSTKTWLKTSTLTRLKILDNIMAQIFDENMAQNFDDCYRQKIRKFGPFCRRKIKISTHVIVEISKLDPCCRRGSDDVRHNRHQVSMLSSTPTLTFDA